jgi:hypothetical protein
MTVKGSKRPPFEPDWTEEWVHTEYYDKMVTNSGYLGKGNLDSVGYSTLLMQAMHAPCCVVVERLYDSRMITRVATLRRVNVSWTLGDL